MTNVGQRNSGGDQTSDAPMCLHDVRRSAGRGVLRLRFAMVPGHIEFMGPMKGWWRKSGYFFSTDYRYGWRVNIRTHERFYRFYFRANAIVKVTVSNQDC